MGWKAYPLTDDPDAPSLPSSSYEAVMEELMGYSFYHQEPEDSTEPDISLDEIKLMLDELGTTDLKERECYRASLEVCLRYCVEHRCGLRVSF